MLVKSVDDRNAFALYLQFYRFQEMGLEKGWGDTAGRVFEMVHLLLELLEAPDPGTLENFLGRIPMVFNVAILSPHGYFAQANVLGLPDTGGQVHFLSKNLCYLCSFTLECTFS